MGTSKSNRSGVTRRAVIAGIGAGLACMTSARATRVAVPRVLFVCQYGSVKSPIARELLRRRARARGISVFAFSRGITPKAYLPAELNRTLLAEGIDPARDGLHRLLPIDARSAEVVVHFDPLPSWFGGAGSLDWTANPSMLASYPASRADLDRRIEALLDLIAGIGGANAAR